MNNNPAKGWISKWTNSTLCRVAKPIFPVLPEFHSGLFTFNHFVVNFSNRESCRTPPAPVQVWLAFIFFITWFMHSPSFPLGMIADKFSLKTVFTWGLVLFVFIISLPKVGKCQMIYCKIQPFKSGIPENRTFLH